MCVLWNLCGILLSSHRWLFVHGYLSALLMIPLFRVAFCVASSDIFAYFHIYIRIIICFLTIKKTAQTRHFTYLRGSAQNGAEGNRTPVRKPIPCSSTIIVLYLTFPPPSEKEHPDGFSSFMIRPHAQSFACVVSHIIDARVLKCGCSKSDSCH